jgi:hypothetical protein
MAASAEVTCEWRGWSPPVCAGRTGDGAGVGKWVLEEKERWGRLANAGL